MRGNAEAHELIAPGDLAEVLNLLAIAPGQWTPIAGGTELMVAFAAGRLGARKLVNLWGIPDLRFIDTAPESFAIGACTTFLDLREHAALAAELPLLAKLQAGSVPLPTRAAPRWAATSRMAPRRLTPRLRFWSTMRRSS